MAGKFGDAFAAARKSGLKTFEWNGKKYTTQTKEEAAAAPRRTATAKPAARANPNYSNEGRGSTAPAPARRGLPTAGERFSKIREDLKAQELANARRKAGMK